MTTSSQVFTSTQYNSLSAETIDLQSVSPDERSNLFSSEQEPFDYLHFVTFLALRNIKIFPLSDIHCLNGNMGLEEWMDNPGNSAVVGSGGSIKVVLCKCRGNELVACKIPHAACQRSNKSSRNQYYSRFMYDMFFEIQVMSHIPFQSHPNITKLLGVSFGLCNQNDAFIYPILLVEPADRTYPDLRRFVESQQSQLPWNWSVI